MKKFFTVLFLLIIQRNCCFAVNNSSDNFRIEDVSIQQFQQDNNQSTENQNYRITYPYGKNEVSISVDPIQIEFGSINPGEPIIRNQTIVIKKDLATNINLYIFEDHPLQSTSSAKIQIPDTSCDDGTCNDDIASIWSNILTFGYGYKCNGEQCQTDFTDKNNFRRFSDSPDSYPIFGSISSGSNAGIIGIVYKVNSSPNKIPGIYSNKITLLSLPGY